MEKVIGALGEAFEAQNDRVTFTYNPTGSGSGIQAVLEGRCDIGLSSRDLKVEESAQGLTGKDTVRAVTVGGVAPTEDAVKDGSYVIQRPFVLVTKTDTPLSEQAQKFFDFATSPKPSYLSDTIGILPDILNTIYIILAALLIVLPLGAGAAVYLTEYAANKRLVSVIEYAAETLSGIPSIIYGLVGMLVFTGVLGRMGDFCRDRRT